MNKGKDLCGSPATSFWILSLRCSSHGTIIFCGQIILVKQQRWKMWSNFIKSGQMSWNLLENLVKYHQPSAKHQEPSNRNRMQLVKRSGWSKRRYFLHSTYMCIYVYSIHVQILFLPKAPYLSYVASLAFASTALSACWRLFHAPFEPAACVCMCVCIYI